MVGEGFLLRRANGHRVQVYTAGVVNAPTVLLLHGGPGGGAKLEHSRYFDLSSVRLVQFDQRGTGLSQFDDPLMGNTTVDQISDIEAIREALGIRSWTVVGGSWGALLALLYAEAHPEVVQRLVLRSVFLDRASDRDWLLRKDGPAPSSRQRLFGLGGTDEDLIAALDRQVGASNDANSQRLAAAWQHYERVLSGLAEDTDEPMILTPRQHLDVRLELHYLARGFFVADDQAASEASALSNVPGVILQGDSDGVIAPDSARHLASNWEGAEVRHVSGGAHSTQCAAMGRAWQHALQELTALSGSGSPR